MNSKWSMEFAQDRILVFRMLDDDPTVRTAEEAAVRFCELMDDMQGNVTFVIDMSSLEGGYEPDARQLWSETVDRYKKRIDKIRVVGASTALLRMAVSLVSMVTEIPMEHHSSLAEAIAAG